MIILILLILLSNNKNSNPFFTNNFLFLFSLFLLTNINYNNSNYITFNNDYISPRVKNSAPHCNSNQYSYTNTNCANNDYSDIYNKTPLQESYKENTNYYTYKYDKEKKHYDNMINNNKCTKEQCISIETNEKKQSINTVSSKNKALTNRKKLLPNASDNQLTVTHPIKSTTIESILNKNINNTNSFSIIPIKNKEAYSLNCINNNSQKPSIKIRNISKGQTVTVLIDTFGFITGKFLSAYNDVLSLKLADNKTLYINSNFISYFY